MIGELGRLARRLGVAEPGLGLGEARGGHGQQQPALASRHRGDGLAQDQARLGRPVGAQIRQAQEALGHLGIGRLAGTRQFLEHRLQPGDACLRAEVGEVQVAQEDLVYRLQREPLALAVGHWQLEVVAGLGMVAGGQGHHGGDEPGVGPLADLVRNPLPERRRRLGVLEERRGQHDVRVQDGRRVVHRAHPGQLPQPALQEESPAQQPFHVGQVAGIGRRNRARGDRHLDHVPDDVRPRVTLVLVEQAERLLRAGLQGPRRGGQQGRVEFDRGAQPAFPVQPADERPGPLELPHAVDRAHVRADELGIGKDPRLAERVQPAHDDRPVRVREQGRQGRHRGVPRLVEIAE